MDKNRKRSFLLQSGLALIAACLFGSGFTLAAEIAAEVHAGYVVTDNIFRVSTNEIDDDIWTVGMSLRLLEESNRVTADIRGAANYLNYNRSFDPEWVGALDAQVDITLVDERLIWTIQDNFGQGLFDPLASPNAGNREDINFLTTGPNLRMGVGNRNFLGLEGRYSNLTYETSPTDNDRVSGLLEFGRRTSAEATISLNASTERVEFSNQDLFVDFDINEAFIAYEILSNRNNLSINAGYSQLDVGFEDPSGILFRVDWTRISSESRSLLFSAGTQYSSQGDMFRFSQSNRREIGETIDIDDDGTPFRSHFFVARYDLNTERTRITITAGWSQDDYEIMPGIGPGGVVVEAFDRDVISGTLFVERDISRSLFVDFNLAVGNRDLKYVNRDDDNFSIGATFGYKFSPALNIYVSYQHVNRDSTNTLDEFTENRGVLGISYIPSWGR